VLRQKCFFELLSASNKDWRKIATEVGRYTWMKRYLFRSSLRRIANRLRRHLYYDRGDVIRFQVAYVYLLDAMILLEYLYYNSAPGFLSEQEGSAACVVVAEHRFLIDTLNAANRSACEAIDKLIH
jgi:hypothetical protein